MIDAAFMNVMGDDELVVDAARVSFSKLSDGYTPAQNERLIKFLAREKHFAPFSHPHITFRCQAPIFVARQLAKHQVGGTWNEVSRRYVKTTPEYWVPSCLREAVPDVKQGSADTIHKRSSEFLEDWNDICIDAVALYQKMVKSGVCGEQARAILPVGSLTEWVWTGSLLFWARVYGLRSAPDTQAETRLFADLIDEHLASLFPISWKALTDG